MATLIPHELTDEQQGIVEDVLKKYHDSRDNKADFMRKSIEWFKWYNMYVPRPKDKKHERKARTSAPQGFSITEHTVAKIKAAVFPPNENNPIIRAFPTEFEDVENADVVELLVNYDLRNAGIRHKGEKWIRNFALFGTAAASVFWRREVIMKTVREPIIIQNPLDGRFYKIGLDFPTQQPVVCFEGPDFEPIDLEDCFPDPAATDYGRYGMRYNIFRFYMPWQRLKYRVESEPELWDKKVFDLINPNEAAPLRDQDSFMDEITRYHQFPMFEQQAYNKGILEVMLYESQTERKVLINRKYPIANMPNPYWYAEIPAIYATRLPITGYPFGKGVIEPIEKTLAYMTAMKNARLDTINLAVNPPWLMLPGMLKKEDQLTQPNKLIEVVSLDAVKPLEIPDYTASVHVEEGRMISDMQEASNLPPFAQGINQGSNIRSTGQQLSLLEMVSERTQMDIDDFGESGMKPLAEWFYALRQQFMTTEQNVRVAGEQGFNWTTVSPSDLSGRYDFRLESTARTMPKAVEAQQRLGFINLIAPVLMNPTGLPEEMLELFKSYAHDSGYIKEAKVLNNIIRKIRMMKFVNGGVMPTEESVNGGAVQRVQGGAGARGEGTRPNNGMDALMSIEKMGNEIMG